MIIENVSCGLKTINSLINEEKLINIEELLNTTENQFYSIDFKEFLRLDFTNFCQVTFGKPTYFTESPLDKKERHFGYYWVIEYKGNKFLLNRWQSFIYSSSLTSEEISEICFDFWCFIFDSKKEYFSNNNKYSTMISSHKMMRKILKNKKYLIDRFSNMNILNVKNSIITLNESNTYLDHLDIKKELELAIKCYEEMLTSKPFQEDLLNEIILAISSHDLSKLKPLVEEYVKSINKNLSHLVYLCMDEKFIDGLDFILKRNNIFDGTFNKIPCYHDYCSYAIEKNNFEVFNYFINTLKMNPSNFNHRLIMDCVKLKSKKYFDILIEHYQTDISSWNYWLIRQLVIHYEGYGYPDYYLSEMLNKVGLDFFEKDNIVVGFVNKSSKESLKELFNKAIMNKHKLLVEKYSST